MESLASYLGISPPDLFAGFCGGVVNFFWLNPRGPKGALGAIVCGALTANWLGVAVGIYFGATTGHIGAFLTGVFGLKLIGEMLKKWRPDFFFEGKPK